MQLTADNRNVVHELYASLKPTPTLVKSNALSRICCSIPVLVTARHYCLKLMFPSRLLSTLRRYVLISNNGKCIGFQKYEICMKSDQDIAELKTLSLKLHCLAMNMKQLSTYSKIILHAVEHTTVLRWLTHISPCCALP